MSDIIIVDNKEVGCLLNFDNLVPITDFVGQKNDTRLTDLTEYLMSFVNVKDVRKKITEDFLSWFIGILKKIPRI